MIWAMVRARAPDIVSQEGQPERFRAAVRVRATAILLQLGLSRVGIEIGPVMKKVRISVCRTAKD